uniref:GBF-interacting protein 1 N-terminal domain-containing protein n=1 Tax=Setaria digitata TaxID=48799 RepID=A0A915Q3U9_9BILA
MGGKGEVGEQKIRATQDQLRLARLTQDLSITDDDRANIQKLVKKVVETTRCTVSQAEIALYDNNNDVQEAVNAILEDNYPDENVWKEQKSRRAKRAEAEELKHEESNSSHRNRINITRSSNNFGYARGRGTERGRSGYRGGRGGGRGSYRGGYQQSSSQGQFSSNMANNVWDNSQALKIDPSKEWTNASAAVVDDSAEDTEWKQHGTLVFSRSTTPPVTATPAVNTVAGISSITPTSGPISFAAVAAAGTNKAKENALKNPLGRAGAGAAQTLGQSQLENINSLYQNSGLVSTSSQLTAPSEEADKGREARTSPLAGHDASGSSNAVSGTAMHAAGVSQQSRVAASVNTVTNTSADWTTQLKNDLGIGGTAPTTKPNVTQSGLMAKSPLQNTKTGQVPRTTRHTTHSSTVEFVSGEANGPTLPEYQFGFHVDSATGSDEHADDVYGTSAKSRPLNSQTTKTEMNPDTSSSSMLSNGPVSDYSSPMNSQQQPKMPAGNGSVSLPQSSPAVHQTNTMQRQPVTSGLSYADTSSMSYPSSDNRNAAKLPLSLHHQQQAPHTLYTTTQLPYANYPYLNMYSPVAGVRQDEYAAALVQYPFGVGQFDMNSLSTMLPPAAAIASQQQQNQPPPPVQSQHQQRPDQHPSIVDLSKAYLATAAAAAANSTIASGTGTGILGNQQQRDSSAVNSSAVAPPPGFSGPPAAAFTLPQHNHINSIFQVPPAAYHPQINQLPFSFMLPNVTNGQHKLNHQMFAQQNVEDSLSDQRLSSQQQKVYQGHQQLDKYGNSSSAKDRLGGGAQATPPPQVYQTQGYMSQQMPLHGHKKAYGGGPQHWSAS